MVTKRATAATHAVAKRPSAGRAPAKRAVPAPTGGSTPRGAAAKRAVAATTGDRAKRAVAAATGAPLKRPAATGATRAADTAPAAGPSRPPVKAGARPAPLATHDDPRFTDLLAAFAGDPDLASIADHYAATQMAGGPRRFGSRALKINDKIFAMLSHGRFVVKLPTARVDVLVAAGAGVHFDPGHGRKMKQWFSLTSATPSWLSLAREACAFVAAASPSRRARRAR